MSEIGFYHLNRLLPDRALPKLLARTLAASERAVVLCADAERVDALDAALWLCPDPVWLPHGTARMGEADLQPVWLTAGLAEAADPPNGARFLFLVDGAPHPDLARFARVFDLFDGAAASAVIAARVRWVAAKEAGHTVTYWQQGPLGWECKA
ncbi:MAG TPA: DNA polymerase III subunit chi [Acetobacteraceae bacterium]|jgi:DNA polymerase III subunit chi|nr:DNA polymerase III subunit chi [Acetobacteraceae bacterium]